MKDRSEIGIVEATARYEAWLAERIPLIKPDLEHKHRAMSAGIFPFLRATFYRWAARWRAIVGDVARAPTVLAVGDLHVENFGTWRDAEGRLVWGVNDFDEAWPLPYTNDLMRLATSALVAREYHDLRIDGKEAVSAILDGYREALEQGGHAFVLAEHHTALREMALYRLHDPETFWDKLESLPTVKTPVPNVVLTSLRRALPEGDLKVRIVRRLAPDCSRVRLNELPRKRDEARLLSAMGWETANVHLGSPASRAIRADVKRRDKRWLHDAARRLADAIADDWRDWRKASE